MAFKATNENAQGDEPTWIEVEIPVGMRVEVNDVLIDIPGAAVLRLVAAHDAIKSIGDATGCKTFALPYRVDEEGRARYDMSEDEELGEELPEGEDFDESEWRPRRGPRPRMTK